MGSIAADIYVTRTPDRSGNYICDGTADDVQIQAAIDELEQVAAGDCTNGGYLVIGTGVYDITNPLVLTGDGNTRGPELIVRCMGRDDGGTVFEPNTSTNCWEFTNRKHFQLTDFMINQPETSGIGIYGDYATYSDVPGAHFHIERIQVLGGSTWAVHLVDPLYFTLRDFILWGQTGDGNMFIENVDTLTAHCDGLIEGMMKFAVYGDNLVGLKLQGEQGDAKTVAHMSWKGRSQFRCRSQDTGCTGVVVEGVTASEIHSIKMENFATAFDIDDTARTVFDNGFTLLMMPDGSRVIDCAANNASLFFTRFYVDTTDGTIDIVNDLNNSATRFNVYHNFLIEGGGIATATFQANTKCRNWFGADMNDVGMNWQAQVDADH